jgi:hypothetical protein
MNAHTPGPWRFRPVIDPSGRLVALLLETEAPNRPCNDPCVMAVRDDWVGALFRGPRQADARLIEAAPELLDAGRALLEWCRENTSPRDENSPHELLIDLAAVIDRAEGIPRSPATASD